MKPERSYGDAHKTKSRNRKLIRDSKLRHQTNVENESASTLGTTRYLNQIWYTAQARTIIMSDRAKFTYRENSRWRQPAH